MPVHRGRAVSAHVIPSQEPWLLAAPPGGGVAGEVGDEMGPPIRTAAEGDEGARGATHCQGGGESGAAARDGASLCVLHRGWLRNPFSSNAASPFPSANLSQAWFGLRLCGLCSMHYRHRSSLFSLRCTFSPPHINSSEIGLCLTIAGI